MLQKSEKMLQETKEVSKETEEVIEESKKEPEKIVASEESEKETAAADSPEVMSISSYDDVLSDTVNTSYTVIGSKHDTSSDSLRKGIPILTLRKSSFSENKDTPVSNVIPVDTLLPLGHQLQEFPFPRSGKDSGNNTYKRVKIPLFTEKKIEMIQTHKGLKLYIYTSSELLMDMTSGESAAAVSFSDSSDATIFSGSFLDSSIISSVSFDTSFVSCNIFSVFCNTFSDTVIPRKNFISH